MSFIHARQKNRSTYRVLEEMSKGVLNSSAVKTYKIDKDELEEYLKKYNKPKKKKIFGNENNLQR